MPTYQLSPVSQKYTNAANPPALDKVVFTIDHIHAGGHRVSSTYEVVKFLVDRKIPVTVFFQATSPSNNYEFDRKNARMIYNLAPHLVTLGVHPLPKGFNQSQHMVVFNLLNDIIEEITGKKSTVLSYHGSGAGPMPGISFPGIQYARGIGSSWSASGDNPLNTPVTVLNSVQRSFEYTTERNAAGLSSTLFVHSSELVPGSVRKEIFDSYISEVLSRRLQAVSYYDAMQADFKATSPDTGGGTNGDNTGGSTGGGTSGGGTGSLRLSASEAGTRRPVKANFKIQKLNGEVVETASNLTSEQFFIPVGKYKVSATALGKTETTEVTLTRSQGLHHVFLIPTNSRGSSRGSGSSSGGTTTPPANSGAKGSLRLSASEKETRRPIKADLLIQDLAGRLIDSASNTVSHLFRLPPATYQVSAIVGSSTATNEITLTATQGIHHIFMVPEFSDGSSGTPTPPTTPTTPPSGAAGLGSLRLSASEKDTRRPMKADFIIEDMNGKLIDTAANVKTSLFRIPAGEYTLKAHANGKFVSATVNLSHTQGIHHIFLIPR